ncbi:MAG: PilW family protein [Dechloromonas sp.]|nr:PilW family protein [Candidatus Dechloromonas phosphoritropha]MBP8786689.1 PilW family protein [Azonexus sp.]MBP9227507.1 PilW family protein [Azonexus sp.]
MIASSPRSNSRQRGLTLVELLIALTIGLFVVGAIGVLYVNTRNGFNYANEVARIQEVGRFALETMNRDIRMAGYNGCSRSVVTSNIISNGSSNPLLDIATPIRGYEGGVDTLPSVLSGAGAISGTDALILMGGSGSGEMVVQSHDPAAAQIKTLGHSVKSGELLMITDCSKASMFQASAVAADIIEHDAGGSPGNCSQYLGVTCPSSGAAASYVYKPGSSMMRVFSNAYFIADSVSNPGTRSLYALALEGTNGTSTKRELLNNVEDMQILYGVDSDGNGTVDSYVTASGVANWSSVISVKIELLVRSSGANVSTGSQTYTFMTEPGDTAEYEVTPSDRILRRVFSETAVARNRTY